MRCRGSVTPDRGLLLSWSLITMGELRADSRPWSSSPPSSSSLSLRSLSCGALVVTLVFLPPFFATLEACVDVFAAVALRFWMPAAAAARVRLPAVMGDWKGRKKEEALPLREFKDFRCGIKDSEEESWRMLMLSTLCSHYRSYSVWSRLGHVSRAHSPWHKTIHLLIS